MNLSESHAATLTALAKVEHLAIARKLGFIPNRRTEISEGLLVRAVGMIDELSRSKNEDAKKIVIISAAILWVYKEENWEGLKDFLIVALNRIGFSPSSIMLDSEYDREHAQFSGIDSLINQFAITVYQLNHEVSIARRKFLLTDFQKRVWARLSEVKLLGISAPTSAGKSFIILLKSIELILANGGNIIYIVPTLSLVAQVSADFNEQLKKFDITNYRICTTFNADDEAQNKIYVLTQEKAIAAFTQLEQPFQNITVLVVDEIQNIEKVPFEGDQRAKTLYDTLIEFRHSSNPLLTILAGPRVEGLKALGIEIFDELESDEERTKGSPVASFTYAISKTKNNYYFNQYCDVLSTPSKIPIVNTDLIKGYGGAQYKDDFIGYLSAFTRSLGNESKNIIFSPTTVQARNTAIELAKLNAESNTDERTNGLVEYIKQTVHEHYDLCYTIPKGYIYHHGRTPSHIRSVLEYAIRGKMIANIVCTTTLMQGVNLPAQNVIMRNPDLAIKAQNGIKPQLTDYEIANLRGRAGRLLKDFIGRTFILEENSFINSSKQGELFSEAEKTLRCGYGEKYQQYKKEIESGLSSNVTESKDNKEYAFLMTYIRQIVLKHKTNSIYRLKSVGIEISLSQLQEILTSLEEQLTLPLEICFKNRYWDPFDLNNLYIKRDEFRVPTSVRENNIEGKLTTTLNKLRVEFPTYYKRYFDVAENRLQSVCISAKEWMKERYLKEILNKPYFSDSDKIDDRISLLQKEISYGLPMLLKPIYDISAPNNMFLRFIEIGAYLPIARKMIELNIPRETAIYLSNNYFDASENSLDNLENLILKRLKEVVPQIEYWRRVQLEPII